MIEKIKKLIGNNKDILLNYKFTLILLLINTIIMVIDLDNNDLTELLTALLLSNVLFFTVETFINKDKKKIIPLLASTLISFGINHILYETDMTLRIQFLILGFYVSIFIMTIYKISKKEENFNKYLLTVFNNNIVLAISSLILEFGLLFISIVTEELLFPNSYFELTLRLEIIFFFLFIVPGEIICLNKTNTEELKISKPLICYILLPIVLFSELIMYIYFFKILLTWTMPENILFTFITILIVIAFPTFILIDNYAKESKFITMINKYVKYSFIPIMIMQLISISIRLFAHGVTITRYFCIMIMAFEIITFILLFKKKNLHSVLIYATILVVIAFIVPFVNSVAISRASQINRLTAIYKEDTDYDKLTIDEKDEIYDIYSYIDYELDAEKYLPNYIDKDKIRHTYIDYKTDAERNINYQNREKEFDIEGYTKFKSLDVSEYHYGNPVKVNNLTLDDLYLTNTATDKEIIETFKRYLANEMEAEEITNNVVILNDNYKYYITYFNMNYNIALQEISNVTIEGYLLIK